MSENQSIDSLAIEQTDFKDSKGFYKWIFDIIRPWAKGRILELQSGSGQLAENFAKELIKIRLSDPNGVYCRFLESKFGEDPIVKSIHRYKPEREDFDKAYAPLLGNFDTVLLLNTVEHDPASQQSLINAKKLLREGGHLIVLLPVRTALYNDLEQGFEEWKRQNHRAIRKAWGVGIKMLAVKFFHVVGASGFELSKENMDPDYQNNIYYQKVSRLCVSDYIIADRIGLSALALGRKT